MKIPLKWLTPVLLRLLSLSHASFANAAAAALQNAGSVHLVTGFQVGLAANPQPHDLSLDSSTYLQLTNQEFALPIMPLHLLGKKSWNVYNQDNIAKVKRDEAIAAAKEAAEEERMQEIDSERRIQILRGERPTPLALADAAHVDDDAPERQHAHSAEQDRPPRDHERKKRKRANEDDTDFELRLARDRQKPRAHDLPSSGSGSRNNDKNNAPLTDSTGHISLFAPPPLSSSSAAASTTTTAATTTAKQHHHHPTAKNPDAELEAARERRAYEDQYTMRFANAAGFKQGLEAPWYSKPVAARDADPLAADGGDGEDNGEEGGGDGRGGAGVRYSGEGSKSRNSLEKSKGMKREMRKRDLWGVEDPGRKRRAAAGGEDPLAVMRQGAAEVRRVERERKRWQEERDREVLDLLVAEREREEREKRRKRRRVDEEDDGLEGFVLERHNGNTSSRHRRHSEDRKEEHRVSQRRSSHRRVRDRSRERESDRNGHRRHSHRH